MLRVSKIKWLMMLIVATISYQLSTINCDGQSINTIKQQCQSPFQSDYGVVKITSAGDIYITPCPGRSIFPSFGTVSPLTTKGDIWGYNTTNARIPVGSNGQVLTADSTNALGVSWQTGGSISGLTTGRLTVATSATTIGDSSLIGTAGVFSPSTAGGFDVGTNALPFSGIYLGSSPTSNVHLFTNSPSAARSATLPNASGVLLITAGLTNNFIPRATSTAGLMSNTPFSWDSTSYLFNNTANNCTFCLKFTPDTAGSGQNFFIGKTPTATADFFCIDPNRICNGVTGLASGQLQASTIRIASYQDLGYGIIFNAAVTGQSASQIQMRAGVSASSINPTVSVRGTLTSQVSAGAPTTSGFWGLGGDGTTTFGATSYPFNDLFLSTANVDHALDPSAIRIVTETLSGGTHTITLPNASGTIALVQPTYTPTATYTPTVTATASSTATPVISGLTTNTIPKAASATTLSDSRILDDGTNITVNSGTGLTGIGDSAAAGNSTLLTVTDSIKQFLFNVGIIKINNDCVGQVVLDASGTFDLSATGCAALAGSERDFVTGVDTVGILTVNSQIIISSAGIVDSGKLVNYWIITN